MSTLASRISKARKKANLTQQQVAERLNVARTSVSHWENGAREPDLKTIRELSELFGVAFEYLVGASNSTPVNQEHISDANDFIKTSLGNDVQVMFRDITSFDDAEKEELKNFINFIKSKKKKTP